MAEVNKLGSGLEISEHDDSYVFRVMKEGNFGLSKSGKSILVGTTHGAIEINGLMFNINIYKPKTPKAKKTKKAIKVLEM